jgi:hypothetical protein
MIESTAMPPRRLLLLTSGIALTLAASISACGDDDSQELTLEDYFGRIENIFQTADDKTVELGEEFDTDLAASDNLDGKVQVLETFLEETVVVFDDAITDMNEIDPPEEAEQAHADFVTAAQGTRDAAEELQGRLEEVETEEDLDSIVSDFETETTATLESLDAACSSLQEIADENEVEADLQCEG